MSSLGYLAANIPLKRNKSTVKHMIILYLVTNLPSFFKRGDIVKEIQKKNGTHCGVSRGNRFWGRIVRLILNGHPGDKKFGYAGTNLFFGYLGTNLFFGYPGIRLGDTPPLLDRSKLSAILERIYFSAIRERILFSAIR